MLPPIYIRFANWDKMEVNAFHEKSCRKNHGSLSIITGSAIMAVPD
jgi:hypothetical protein